MDDHYCGIGHGQIAGRGFTLLEVLVSLAIIATVLVSIIRLQGQTISMNETVRFYSLAPFLAQSRVAQIRMEPDSFMGEEGGDFGPDFPGYIWQSRVQSREINIEDNGEINFLEAGITVRHSSWGLVYEITRQISAKNEESRP
jgi:general secretion pathway protein I